MARKDAERGLLLRGPEIHGGNEIEEAVPDHRSHHEAREDRDQFLQTRGGERQEDEALEGAPGGEEQDGDVVHVETGGEARHDPRGNPEQGEGGDGEQEEERFHRPVEVGLSRCTSPIQVAYPWAAGERSIMERTGF